MTNAPADPAGDAPPLPSADLPRVRGWSRALAFARGHPMGAGVAALLAVTLGVRLGVGWQLGREWSNARVAVVARGGSVDPADIRPAGQIPDAENAWLLQAQAAATVQSLSPASGNVAYPSYPPFGPLWEKAAAASEAANAPAFALARDARGRPRAQIPMAGGVPLITVLLPHLSQSRELANALSDGALYKHLAGEEAEALGRVRDLLYLARSLRQEPILVTQMVAAGIDMLTTERAQAIAAGLRLDGPDGPSARGQTRGLIADLLDEKDVLQGSRRSLGVGWLGTAELVQLQAGETWAIAPLADRQAARLAEAAAVDLTAAKADNAADALAALALAGWPDKPPSPGFAANIAFGPRPAVPRYSRWFGDESGRTPSRYFRALFDLIAQRRATALSLAIQLYRVDHGGQWPNRLSELVPTYLPAVPADPFHADGRPIGYVVRKGVLPGGRDRPLVYYDAGPADGVQFDPEPMFGSRTEIRPGQRAWEPFRQHVDLAIWTPAVRRFDVQQAEEARKEAEVRREEEAEAARLAEEGRKAVAENGIVDPDASATTRPATGPATR